MSLKTGSPGSFNFAALGTKATVHNLVVLIVHYYFGLVSSSKVFDSWLDGRQKSLDTFMFALLGCFKNGN